MQRYLNLNPLVNLEPMEFTPKRSDVIPGTGAENQSHSRVLDALELVESELGRTYNSELA